MAQHLIEHNQTKSINHTIFMEGLVKKTKERELVWYQQMVVAGTIRTIISNTAVGKMM